MADRSPRVSTTGVRRSLGALLAVWCAALGLGAVVARVAIIPPESCPDATIDDLRASVGDAIAWFAANQRPDGTWRYRYDARSGRDLPGYNAVRHAGVLLALEQMASSSAAGARAELAAEIADGGLPWAIDRLEEAGEGALVLDTGGSSWSAGGSALLVAALGERRLRTGDPRHDERLRALGRFLVGQVDEDGAVDDLWDSTEIAPVSGSRSPFTTGEVFFALARLERLFPGEGWAEPAERVLGYLRRRRDRAESRFPPISDHWASYGVAERLRWDDAPELSDGDVRYVRRQSQLASAQIRYDAQRTNEPPNVWLRGHRVVGAGLGTIGESLGNWSVVAASDPRLAGLRAPVTDRLRCAAGVIVDRQASAEEAQSSRVPSAVAGSWPSADRIIQMDDQQHTGSALALAISVLTRADVPEPGGPPDRQVPVLIVMVALVVAIGPSRLGTGTRGIVGKRRLVGGLVGSAVLGGLVLLGDPLFDWAQVSAVTARTLAGAALAAGGAVAIIRSPCVWADTAGRRWRWILPVTVPGVLAPVAIAVALVTGADHQGSLVVAGSAAVAAAVTSLVLAPLCGRMGPWIGRLTGVLALGLAAFYLHAGILAV